MILIVDEMKLQLYLIYQAKIKNHFVETSSRS